MPSALALRASLLLAAPLLLAMQEPPFGAGFRPLEDPALEAERGRFLLPNGVELAMTVRTETSIDGHIVLRSVFLADQGPPTLNVYAPAAGQTGPASGATGSAGSAAGQAGVSVSIDRAAGIVRVQPTFGMGGTSPVVVSNGAGSAGSPALPAVDLSHGPQATGAGQVSVTPLPSGSLVQLAAPDLSISHIFGQAFGSAVANSGSDRSIDTVTSVGLDIHNATPAILGSSMLRAEAVALDATRAMVR